MNSMPERFEVSASSVTITWDDGERSVLDATVLRAACPCAGCRDGGPDRPDPGSGQVPTIIDARMVGGYAINFTFGDGHGTGIYPFSMLRSLASPS
jgi:DUF971 family protein